MITILGAMLIAALFAADRAFRKPVQFVVFLLAAGMLRFGASAGDLLGGSMDLSSIWLLGLICLSVFVLLRSHAFSSRITGPEVACLFFLGWCVFQSLRMDDFLFSTRMFLKLLYPLLVMMLARTLIRTPESAQRLLKWVMGAAFGAYLLLGGPLILLWPQGVWTIAPLFWVGAAFADHTAIMTVLALVCWRLFRQQRYLIFAVLLAIVPVWMGVRTGIVATAMGVGLFALIEFGRRSVPLLAGVYVATAVALFAMPQTRAKMFYDADKVDSSQLIFRPDQISMDDVNSSGRFTMWGVVMDKFFWPDPFLGSGLGATQKWFYSGGYGDLRVEHSEFVRLLSDTGLVGLVLYVTAVLVGAASGWRTSRTACDPTARSLGVAAACAFPTFLVCMGFDNVLNYALPAGQYPFAFVGLALGVQQALARQPGVQHSSLRPARQGRWRDTDSEESSLLPLS